MGHCHAQYERSPSIFDCLKQASIVKRSHDWHKATANHSHLLPTLHAAALRGLNSIVSFLTSIALFVNVTGNSSPSIDRN